MVDMVPIRNLNLGYVDAEIYQRRDEKKFFNTIFTRNIFLDQLLKPTSYFLIGEKGTGKTAYAVFLSNNNYLETVSELKYIRETDYKKFISLKRNEHLGLSDYTSIWKVIILLLLSEHICRNKSELAHSPIIKWKRIRSLMQAVEEYYSGAFSPEIISILNWVEDFRYATELVVNNLKLEGGENVRLSGQEARFQTNLSFIERQFKKALSDLKLKGDHILFIDGIDIRPGSIKFDEYLECIKGLVNAVWELNNDFFPNIRDSKGRFRAVLLIRPDIFMSVEMQNSTNKVRDNSVFLDWRTTYPSYRSSRLFEITDKLLLSQQNIELPPGMTWDYYFPWKSNSTNVNRAYDDSFIPFLRISYSRPRDIIAALQILQEEFNEKRPNSSEVFREKDLKHSDFMTKYSEYLMGSIRDQLAFYYNKDDYSLFLRFFGFLNGASEFSYEEYLKAYNQFTDYVLKHQGNLPNFVESPDKFIQFLYNSNLLCYIDRTEFEPLFRFCYRERSPSNIEPKVAIGKEYRIHYGLYKALNVGPYGNSK